MGDEQIDDAFIVVALTCGVAGQFSAVTERSWLLVWDGTILVLLFRCHDAVLLDGLCSVCNGWLGIVMGF